MLRRMDLLGPDKMHFEIFSQVLLTSLIITEIPQGHHNHFQQILMLVEGFGVLPCTDTHIELQAILVRSAVLVLNRKLSMCIIDRREAKG